MANQFVYLFPLSVKRRLMMVLFPIVGHIPAEKENNYKKTKVVLLEIISQIGIQFVNELIGVSSNANSIFAEAKRISKRPFNCLRLGFPGFSMIFVQFWKFSKLKTLPISLVISLSAVLTRETGNASSISFAQCIPIP